MQGLWQTFQHLPQKETTLCDLVAHPVGWTSWRNIFYTFAIIITVLLAGLFVFLVGLGLYILLRRRKTPGEGRGFKKSLMYLFWAFVATIFCTGFVALALFISIAWGSRTSELSDIGNTTWILVGMTGINILLTVYYIFSYEKPKNA